MDDEEAEYSLDEDATEGDTNSGQHNENDTTASLLASARNSVNLPPVATTRASSTPSRPATTNKRPAAVTQRSTIPAKKTKTSTPASVNPPSLVKKPSVNFLNSDKWDKTVRPPFLQDDEVFNAISVEAAAQSISSWMTTKAMMDSNKIKETKSRAIGGKENPDEEVNTIDIEAGKDDALTNLHKQRFCFRTPLLEPKEYWNLVPLKWKEINKSIYLENVGLDNVLSPRTIEMIHDRSSPLEIKMFLTINISVGRSGIARKQNLRTLDDGSTEVVHADDWLSPTTINQLVEALDNLSAAWTVMWPGEWSVITLRRVVTKHLAFGDIQNADLRKRMLESFINEVLASNSSLASRGKPPMMFEKVDRLANKYLDNKRHYEQQFKVEQSQPKDNTPIKTNAQKLNEEIRDLRRGTRGLKTGKGRDVCLYFNTSVGCKMKAQCKFDHSCSAVKEGGKELCGGNHKKSEHKRN